MVLTFNAKRPRATKRRTPTPKPTPAQRTRAEKLAALERVYPEGLIPIDAMIDLLLFQHELAASE